MDHFHILERELKSRYNKALKEPVGSNFVLAVFEYLRVIETSPLLKGIMNKHKIYFGYSEKYADKDEYALASKNNIWDYYSKLHDEVYEPLKNDNFDSIKKHFSHFVLMEKTYYEPSLWIFFPKAWKAKYKHLRYTNRLKAIQPKLLTELADWKIQKTAPEIHTLQFDEKNSLLFLDSFKVEINKQSRKNNAHLLLVHIFSQGDISEEFFYEDMAEAFFGARSKYDNNPNPYRFACKQVNEAIYSEMRKSNIFKKTAFLLYNNKRKGSCRINPSYLS